jgi:hypothetical protein
MSANIANISAVSSTEITTRKSRDDIIKTMPSWMSISEGETIGTDHPKAKCSLKQKLGAFGRGFKQFFTEQGQIYRIEK